MIIVAGFPVGVVSAVNDPSNAWVSVHVRVSPVMNPEDFRIQDL